MLSTFGAFEAAKSGLSVSMQQLNVTEQNISNVNTEGYTRQRILTSAKEPSSSSYLIAQLNKANVGQGVETTGIQQVRSAYLDQQYRNLNTTYTDSSTKESAMKYLSGLFNELSDDSSMTTAVTNFFSALNTFSSNTSLDSYRTNVQQQAESMTVTFRNVYQEMQSLWQDQNDSIKESSDTVNSLAQSIASLNDLIARSEQTVGTANDLVDERNVLLDKLSGYVNITYQNNTSNSSMVDVSIGGVSLVSGKTASKITLDTMAHNKTTVDGLLNDIADKNADPVLNKTAIDTDIKQLKAFGKFDIAQADASDPASKWIVKLGGQTLVTGIETGSPAQATMTAEAAADIDAGAWAAFNSNNLYLNSTALNGLVTSGKLYANIAMATNDTNASQGIPFYMDQLNNLVRSIAKNINDIHQTGYTYPNGVPNPSTYNVSFFDVPPLKDAGGLPVTKTVGSQTLSVYDYSKLTAGTFQLSDKVKQSIYNIAGSSTPIKLDGASPDSGNNTVALVLSKDLDISGYKDTIAGITTNLAITAKTTSNDSATKKSLLDSVDTQRKSTSAVSLDEETTNLIIFQQSYNAAARVITTLDDMLNRMINNMGITGT